MNPGSNSRFHDFTAHTAVASKKVLHSFSWQGLRNLNWVWIACSIFIPNPVSLYPAAGMAYAGPSGMSAFKGELRFYDGDRNIVHGMPLHFQSGIFPEELAVVFNDHRHANQAPMQPILLVQDPVRNLYVPAVPFYIPVACCAVEYTVDSWMMDPGVRFGTGMALASFKGGV